MKLDLRFIVPGPAAGTVLLDAGGALPAAIVDGSEQEAAVVPATAFLRGSWGLGTPVLETHPKWKDIAEGDPIPTLVLTEPAPADWTPPAGLAFGPVPATANDAPLPISTAGRRAAPGDPNGRASAGAAAALGAARLVRARRGLDEGRRG